MTPFTEVLEHFARLLPDGGGVCINAESELEAVGMAWGALATGARAATGSTGQGLSLMQESFSEITLAELPLVIFNMARGQQDYYQATRGGGHGDYRHIVLAPQDVREGVELVQLAFHLADKWRNPVLHLRRLPPRAHAGGGRGRAARASRRCRRRTGRSTARMSGSGASRERHAARRRQVRAAGARPGRQGAVHRDEDPVMEREVRVESGFLDDAETVIVAFGSPAKFVKYAIKQLREAGHRIGYVRPITLWPFPYDDGRRGRGGRTCAASGSFELSRGPDGRRRAHRRRGPAPVSSSAASRPTTRASASAASSTSTRSSPALLALHETDRSG